VKELNSPRRSQSLIEEEFEGPLIWSWLKSVEFSRRTRALNLERTGVKISDTPNRFTMEICVCGE
jgi:hypothetical protein